MALRSTRTAIVRLLAVAAVAAGVLVATYLGHETVTLSGPGSGIWDTGSVSFLRGSASTVYIRFSVLGGAAGSRQMVNVDDVAVSCQPLPFPF